MASTPAESLCQIASDPQRVAALHGLVGDFCHLLRNRLNSLQMSLYLARRDGAGPGADVWDELERHYRAAEGVVELFQTVCRPMALTTVSIGLGLLLGDFGTRWAPRFAARQIALCAGLAEADGPSRLDPSRIAQGLDALAAWRLDRAEPQSRISVRGWVQDGRSRLEWIETGSPRSDHDGELPLAALSRIASAHGGWLAQEHRDGWRVRIEWPHHVPADLTDPAGVR